MALQSPNLVGLPRDLALELAPEDVVETTETVKGTEIGTEEKEEQDHGTKI